MSPEHPNARVIEALYEGIRTRKLGSIAACYADDAYFEDIAFRRRGRSRVMEMWRLVCHAEPCVTPYGAAADDLAGTGSWRAQYWFGKTATNPGRWVDNTLSSTFRFRNGLIVEHRDCCDPKKWARQAFRSPRSIVVGSVEPVRRAGASLRLRSFLNAERRRASTH